MSIDLEGNVRSQAAAVIEAIGDLVFELTREGVFVGYIGGREQLMREPEQFIGKSVYDVLPRDVAEMTMRTLEAVHKLGTQMSFEYCLPMHGGPRYFEARLVPGSNGHLFAVVRDIDDRRTIELQMRESEARFRVMADHAPVMLWKADSFGDCDFFNRRWLEFTGRSLETEYGVGWAEGVHPADFQRCMDTFLASFVERKSFRMEYRLRRADGEYRWILDQGAPRFAPQGVFEGYVGSCIDVTDMREAADQIKRLNGQLQERVREREVLLREIHHRVKNNLQLISSILNLQARLLHGEARGLVEEGQTRVHAIALVHEKLCDSETMSDVDLVSYARDLVQVVRRAIGASAEVDLRIEGEPTRVAVDQAVPCGLIINELVTNAFKHAFPEGRAGRVCVEVRRASGQRVTLIVRDDGVGLPEHVDLKRPDTLGLDLVVTLARQLNGSLEVIRERGSAFAVTIPMMRVN
jgi:PAS domain S-box-containing protein